MDELIKAIKESWDNIDVLEKVQLDIVIEYSHQANVYAESVSAEAATFNAEMENSFKPSVTKAEFRAKEVIGTSKITAEKNMRALEMLFDAIKMRVTSFKKLDTP